MTDEELERQLILKEFDALPENKGNLVDEETKTPYKFSPAAAMFNLPFSAGEAAWDATYPIRHPINTAKGLAGVGKGLYQKITPGVQEDEATIDAIVKGAKDRYGSGENILKTLENDPAGVALDITGAGGLLARAPGLAGKAGQLANKLDPINAIANTIPATRKARQRKLDPIDEMLQATKFGTTIDIKGGYGARRKLAETMLENGYELSDDGIKSLIADMDKLGLKMDDILKNTPAAQIANIPRSAIEGRYIPDLLARKTNLNRNISPEGNRRVIESELDNFRTAGQELGPQAPLSANDVNALKKDFYDQSAYGKSKSAKKTLKAEINRNMGRGAKDIVEEAIPEIRDYNQQWGKLAELKPELMRASGRVGNRDSGGLMPAIRAGAAGLIGGNISPMIAIPAAYLGYRSGRKALPKNKSKEAQGIYDLQQKSYTDIYNTTGKLPNLLRANRLLGSYQEEESLSDTLQGLLDNYPS